MDPAQSVSQPLARLAELRARALKLGRVKGVPGSPQGQRRKAREPKRSTDRSITELNQVGLRLILQGSPVTRVCRYFQRGICRYGNECPNSHITAGPCPLGRSCENKECNFLHSDISSSIASSADSSEASTSMREELRNTAGASLAFLTSITGDQAASPPPAPLLPLDVPGLLHLTRQPSVRESPNSFPAWRSPIGRRSRAAVTY